MILRIIRKRAHSYHKLWLLRYGDFIIDSGVTDLDFIANEFIVVISRTYGAR